MSGAVANFLLISCHLHDDRYLGAGPWPPAPARLFQALVSAASHGNEIAPPDRAALEWLEKLGPPEIAVPRSRRGQAVVVYVPNNDLDYDSWVRIGMAIKGSVGEAGKDVFTDWSDQAAKNEVPATEKAWASFRPTAPSASTRRRSGLWRRSRGRWARTWNSRRLAARTW